MKWSDPKKKLQIFLCFLKVASRWQVVRMKGTHEVFEATTIEINQQSVEAQIGMFNINTNTRGEKFQSLMTKYWSIVYFVPTSMIFVK